MRFTGVRRFPVVLAGTDTEIRTGEEADVEAEAPALLKFTIVSQPGLPRRQIYYPYMSFRLSRPLQVDLTSETSALRSEHLACSCVRPGSVSCDNSCCFVIY